MGWAPPAKMVFAASPRMLFGLEGSILKPRQGAFVGIALAALRHWTVREL